MIGLIFYWGMNWRYQIEEAANAEYRLFPVVVFSIIFSIVMGMLCRFPQLMIDIKENKKWTFDWPKFIAVGLPTLLILILYILSSLGIVPILHLIFIGDSTLITIAGIVFGYVLLDSLRK